jgi:Uma2 family endonuclease
MTAIAEQATSTLATSLPTTLLSAEAFWARYGHEKHVELVDGEVRYTEPVGGKHGAQMVYIGAELSNWTKKAGGAVGAESGFHLKRNPDTVRSPDVFYVRPEHLPTDGIPDAYWQQAPDLVVEIVSPSETASEVDEKVVQYLEAGVALVWLVYPKTRRVVIYEPGDVIHILSHDAVLTHDVVLPGFRCILSDIFG